MVGETTIKELGLLYLESVVVKESPDMLTIGNLERDFLDDPDNVTFFVNDDLSVEASTGITHKDMRRGNLKDDFRGRYFVSAPERSRYTGDINSEEERKEILAFWQTIYEIHDNLDKFNAIVNYLKLDLDEVMIETGDDEMYSREDFVEAMNDIDEERANEAEYDREQEELAELEAKVRAQKNAEAHMAGGIGKTKSEWGNDKNYGGMTKAEYNALSQTSECVLPINDMLKTLDTF